VLANTLIKESSSSSAAAAAAVSVCISGKATLQNFCDHSDQKSIFKMDDYFVGNTVPFISTLHTFSFILYIVQLQNLIKQAIPVIDIPKKQTIPGTILSSLTVIVICNKFQLH
jgi:hypothetical protein